MKPNCISQNSCLLIAIISRQNMRIYDITWSSPVNLLMTDGHKFSGLLIYFIRKWAPNLSRKVKLAMAFKNTKTINTILLNFLKLFHFKFF